LTLALAGAALGAAPARAQSFLNQDWLLNPTLSNVYLETVKANAIFEAHHFSAVEGGVSKDGDAVVKIDLASLETGIDIRNVRMRFLLFETFKFPYAVITAKLDKSKLQALATTNRVNYPLDLKVSMHGIDKQIQTEVWITRISDTTVSVATTKPIIVTAETFGFTENVAKLVDAVGGTMIAPGASITFDLVFGTGSLKSDLEVARASREKTRAEEATAALSKEECETRFSVISRTGAIYFESGSAELDRESEPLLNSGADIANRCPGVRFEVAGHTDNVGAKRSNQALSEQRAKAVVDYLTAKGVSAARIHSAGFGDARPVAPNDNERNRAKNRRIEFTVTND
jgi:outer membrane protein OmpA-like peptidoglycan-associated protein